MRGISEYVLKRNGLRILYMHTKGTKTVTTNLVYFIGSRQEARGETGIAHMFEHMMFKHTGSNGKKDKVLQWKALENAGALMNANTSLDRTSYFSSLPTSYYEDMLRTEARRMRHLLLVDKEFLPERANVLSEYEMYAGNPLVALETAINGASYISHPYGHDPLGYKSDIEHFTIEKLRKYYDAYYRPDNACLIVIGDIEKTEALLTIKKTFAHIPCFSSPIPNEHIEEPEQLGERRVEVKKQTPVNIVSINFKGVPGTHADWLPLNLLLAHLAEGVSSVLYKKLIDTHKASSVTPYEVLTYDAFLCGIITYISKRATHQEIEESILAEIEHLQKKPLTQKELSAVKNRVRASELYERDGGYSIARALTEFVAIGDWTKYFTLINNIDRITAADLKRVATTYLVENGRTIGRLIGTTK